MERNFMSMITTTMRKEKYKEKITALMPQFDFVEIYNACESEETNAKARSLPRNTTNRDLAGAMRTGWTASAWRTANFRKPSEAKTT